MINGYLNLLNDRVSAIGNAMNYFTFYSQAHRAVICVYDEEGNAMETHEQAGEFKEP